MTTKQVPWWKEPTRAQWSSFLAAWTGWVLDAFDFTIFLLVMHEISTDMGVGITALSGSITLTLLVRLLGGAAAGWMADKWGRKLPLMLSIVGFAIFDFAIAFAPSFMWIVIFRTAFGFCMGAEWTAGTAMAMENWPVRSRKIASGLLQAGWPIGFLLSAAVAYFVVPAWGWRAMFVIAALPALIVIPIRFLVRDDSADRVAAAAAAARAAGTAAPVVKRNMWAELWEPSVRQMLVLGSLVMALGFIVYYGLTAHYSMMLIGEHGVSKESAFLDVILFNLGMLTGVLCAGTVANRFGIVTALVAPALLMVPALPLYVGAVPALLPLGAFLGGLLGVGYSGVTPVLTTSLFPDHVRARAIGFVYHTGALIAAFVPTVIAELSTSTDLTLSGAIGLVVGIGLVGMALAVLALRKRLELPATTVASPSLPEARAIDGAAREAAAPALHALPVRASSQPAVHLH